MPPPKHAILSAKTADTVQRVNDRVTRAQHFAPQRPSKPPVAQGYGAILRAVVTTAIPTGTISSPSTSGRATLYRWDSAAGTSSEDTARTGVRVCNDHTLSASIASGKAIKVSWIDGDYWLIAADC